MCWLNSGPALNKPWGDNVERWCVLPKVNIYSDSVEMAQVMSSFYTMPGEDAVDLRIGLTRYAGGWD